MQAIDIEKARLVKTTLEGAIKSAEAKGASTVDLTDVLLGADDAARAVLQAAIEAANKAQAASKG